MVIKLKKADIDRAVKEYIEKLFVGSQVTDVTYHRRTKSEDSVLVEAEIKTQNTGEVK